jgi:hypothetical protein
LISSIFADFLPWPSGAVFSSGAMGREIESRQGIGWKFYLRKEKIKLPMKIFSSTTYHFFKLTAHQGCQMVCFQTKIPIWVNFGGFCKGRCWYI